MKKPAHAAAATAPPTLSERQKKVLRARALEDHELIKVKGPAGDRAARDELFAALARETGSTLVYRIGNIAVLYRPHPKLPRILIPDR